MKNNREFLTYDIKTGEHRTAAEEWTPHKPLSPNFFEWHYLTALLDGGDGNQYFILWANADFSSESYFNVVKQANPNLQLPPGMKANGCFTILSNYNQGSSLSDMDMTFQPVNESFDFETNTVTYRSQRYQSDWAYDGKNVNLMVKGPKFNLDLSSANGDFIMWAQDKLGIHGFIQQGAPEDRSFYYSLTNLPLSGMLTVKAGDGSETKVEVTGKGWIDRQWGDYLTYAWEWASFRFADGDRINLYNFANGYQVGTYQKAGGTCEYFDSFKVIQNGYAKTPNNTWFSYGWSYELPVKGKKYTVVPISPKDTMAGPGNNFYEGAGRLLDETGKQVGWSVNESMDVRLMENAPYQKFQNN